MLHLIIVIFVLFYVLTTHIVVFICMFYLAICLHFNKRTYLLTYLLIVAILFCPLNCFMIIRPKVRLSVFSLLYSGHFCRLINSGGAIAIEPHPRSRPFGPPTLALLASLITSPNPFIYQIPLCSELNLF